MAGTSVISLRFEITHTIPRVSCFARLWGKAFVGKAAWVCANRRQVSADLKVLRGRWAATLRCICSAISG